MADSTRGGRIRLTINGASFTTRAKAKVYPSRASIKNGANQNGSMWSSVDPELARLEATFDRGSGIKWTESMLLATINATFTETDLSPNVNHMFTAARWEGKPEIDTETGEISGLAIVSDTYQQA